MSKAFEWVEVTDGRHPERSAKGAIHIKPPRRIDPFDRARREIVSS
jgi:hypothetical protein